MKLSKYSVTIFSLLFTLQIYASPQMPDYIIYKNDTIPTYNLLLEQYLQKMDTSKSESLFGLSFRDGASFSCWRGYQAIYKIENDSLFLTDIINCGERRSGQINKNESTKKMKDIFGSKIKNNRIGIDWFSGILSFPLNNKLLRWDGVFYKIYEKETAISIDKGKIIKVEAVNNYSKKPNAIDRKNKDKISDILFEKLKKVKWQNSDKIDCSEKYLITIDKEGKVAKVAMLGYDTDEKIDEYWERDEYAYCINTIYSALKKLSFDIIKDKGNPISEDIYIEIFFDIHSSKIENHTH